MRTPRIGDIVTYRSAVGLLCEGRVIKITAKHVLVMVNRIDHKSTSPVPSDVNIDSLLSIHGNRVKIIDHGSYYSTEPI